MTGPFSERQFVKRADVEGVTYVEVVVATIGFEEVRIAAVLASFEPAVLPRLRENVYCELSVKPLVRRRASVICKAL